MPRNFGYIPDIRTPEDYEQLGGISTIHKEVRRPDGQWLDDIPEGEIQIKRNFESYSCVSFGTLNVIEILSKVKFGEKPNYSDRFLSVSAETTSQGNSPKKVADVLRHKGSVPEEMWPFTDEMDSFEKFHAPIPEKIKREGLKFLDNWEIGYESVPSTPEELMVSLQYSPLGVAVEAWKQDEKGYYYGGENPNHWTCLIGYVKGDSWLVYDSYPETAGSYCKKLKWDYKFSQTMSYSLNKKKLESLSGGSFLKKIFDFFKWWAREILAKS